MKRCRVFTPGTCLGGIMPPRHGRRGLAPQRRTGHTNQRGDTMKFRTILSAAALAGSLLAIGCEDTYDNNRGTTGTVRSTPRTTTPAPTTTPSTTPDNSLPPSTTTPPATTPSTPPSDT